MGTTTRLRQDLELRSAQIASRYAKCEFAAAHLTVSWIQDAAVIHSMAVATSWHRSCISLSPRYAGNRPQNERQCSCYEV